MEMMPTFEKVKSDIQKAVMRLYRYDHFLITNTTNERSITHKLAEYLQVIFDEWNVDCEYNRRGEGNTKDLSDQSTSYPDIIIHLRNTKKNLLVIEAKSVNSQDHDDTVDKGKIKQYIENPKYFYLYGLWLLFANEIDEMHKDWFQNVNGKCIQV